MCNGLPGQVPGVAAGAGAIVHGNYGVTREALTKSQILELPVPVPDPGIQESLVKRRYRDGSPGACPPPPPPPDNPPTPHPEPNSKWTTPTKDSAPPYPTTKTPPRTTLVGKTLPRLQQKLLIWLMLVT